MSDSRMVPYNEGAGIRVIPGRQTAIAKLDDDRVAALKRTYFKGLDEGELEVAMAVTERTGLSPEARQIFFIKRWDAQARREVMQPQISIDGFRLIAERTGQYAGQLGPFWCGEDGIWRDIWLSKTPPAAAKVSVLHRGFSEPLTAVARFDSYAQRTKDGTLTRMWQSMPDLMIGKCAESLALRRAFPQELSGLYTDTEMMQAVEVEGRIDGQATRPQTAPDDPQRALAALDAAAADLGMSRDDIRQFVADRASKPVDQVASMTTWSVKFIGRTRELIEAHGDEWVHAQVDAIVDAEVIETGLEGTVRRPLRPGEFLDEVGQIVPAEDAADATPFPTAPASLLPSEDGQSVNRRDWTT